MKYILFLIASMLILSCDQTKFDSREDLLSYIKNPESGYLQSKQINGVDVALMYRPTDLLVAQELTNYSNLEAVDSIRKRYQNYHYFNLNLSQYGKEILSTAPKTQREFSSMVNQLSFGMDKKIHLYTSQKDTIPLADYIYPRLYGMSGSTTLLLVYPKTEKTQTSKYLTLAIEDFGLKTGEIKFKISNKVLENKQMLSFK